mmetsp:Transcript_39644/g.112429  ORF Transcript_39644/g.112429 Transcript_39644/m.112429 type:complete len:308 (-) Transcript_39644:1826-2749(-)
MDPLKLLLLTTNWRKELKPRLLAKPSRLPERLLLLTSSTTTRLRVARLPGREPESLLLFSCSRRRLKVSQASGMLPSSWLLATLRTLSVGIFARLSGMGPVSLLSLASKIQIFSRPHTEGCMSPSRKLLLRCTASSLGGSSGKAPLKLFKLSPSRARFSRSLKLGSSPCIPGASCSRTSSTTMCLFLLIFSGKVPESWLPRRSSTPISGSSRMHSGRLPEMALSFTSRVFRWSRHCVSVSGQHWSSPVIWLAAKWTCLSFFSPLAIVRTSSSLPLMELWLRVKRCRERRFAISEGKVHHIWLSDSCR